MYQDAVSKATSHACLTLLLCSAISVHIHKLSVCAPVIPSKCASRGGGRGESKGIGGEERGTGRSEKEWEGTGKSSPTMYSLIHSFHVPSFPSFQELSKESLSPALQLQSSSVQLPHCVCACLCNIYICIYKYRSVSDSFSVETFFGRGFKTEKQKLL